MATGPSIGGIALRALSALILVFATYNPEGKSFYHWAIAPLLGGAPGTGPASVKFLAGIALVQVSIKQAHHWLAGADNQPKNQSKHQAGSTSQGGQAPQPKGPQLSHKIRHQPKTSPGAPEPKPCLDDPFYNILGKSFPKEF